MEEELPKVEKDLKSLRIKADYMQTKFENEQGKILQLSGKKKNAMNREDDLVEKETKIIERAKRKYNIDFTNADHIV